MVVSGGSGSGCLLISLDVRPQLVKSVAKDRQRLIELHVPHGVFLLGRGI